MVANETETSLCHNLNTSVIKETHKHALQCGGHYKYKTVNRLSLSFNIFYILNQFLVKI